MTTSLHDIACLIIERAAEFGHVLVPFTWHGMELINVDRNQYDWEECAIYHSRCTECGLKFTIYVMGDMTPIFRRDEAALTQRQCKGEHAAPPTP